MWDDSEQGIKSMMKACERDGDKNTLDDLIEGLQKLRAKYGNLRVVYDCSYNADSLLIQDFTPLKDAKDKVLGFCLYF